MKRIVIEVEDTLAQNWVNCRELRNRIIKMVNKELTYPPGYGRPDEQAAWAFYQHNLIRLPETVNMMKKHQEEAAKNGLTAEILKNLLADHEN